MFQVNADITTYLEDLAIKVANNQKPILISRRKLHRDTETHRKKESGTKTTNLDKNDIAGRNAKRKRRRTSSSVLNKSSSSDVVVIDDDEPSNYNTSDDDDDDDDDDESETSFVEEKRLMKVVFLKFEENTRPPYYGTWRKKSKNISGRRPFGQDTVRLNLSNSLNSTLH